MGFSDFRAQLVQIIHDRDDMPLERVKAFSRKRFWAYRAIAAGELTGEDLSFLIEVEKEPAVIRQLGFNPDATSEHLERLADLWLTDPAVIESNGNFADLRYAIAMHENVSDELRRKIAPDWKF